MAIAHSSIFAPIHVGIPAAANTLRGFLLLIRP